MSPVSVSAALDQLAARFSGRLLTQNDPGYDDARKVYNGLIDKRPTLIARCRNLADIVDAVNFARDYQLEVAVKGGGHNVAGRATINGGVMIDLSLMKGILVEPRKQIARVQGGVTWGEYNRETQLHGLASTGGVVSTTGVAGLTLGGGLGWLQAKYGLACDNLRSVQMVTAEGRVLTSSPTENADLFWGLRGGGGNFGVVGSMEFMVHPVGPMITGGLAAHPFAKAAETLQFFRDTTMSMPDELTLFAGLVHAPDGSGAKLAALLACHCGSAAEGEAAMKPIKTFGPPVIDAIGPMPYTAMNQMLDAGYPKGALNYWKSAFLPGLTDEAIATMVECYARVPSPMAGIILEHLHGAAVRIDAQDTAFPHRNDGYNLLFLTQWMDPADTARCIDWTRESFEAMRPHMSTGRYVNYLSDDEPDAAADAYGPNYAKLQELKAKYDPTNFFHMNQNIKV